MKNNLYKVFNRFVTGLLTMTVLVACGQDTNDISLNEDEKKQEAKSKLVSRTNSVQIQNTARKTDSGSIKPSKTLMINSTDEADNQASDDFNKGIRDQLTELRTTISNLANSLLPLKDDVTNVIDELADANTIISKQQTEIDLLKKDIADLEAQKPQELSASIKEVEMLTNIKNDFNATGMVFKGVYLINGVLVIERDSYLNPVKSEYDFYNNLRKKGSAERAIIEKYTGKTIKSVEGAGYSYYVRFIKPEELAEVQNMIDFYKDKYSQYGPVKVYYASKDWYKPDVECLYFEVDLVDTAEYSELQNIYNQILQDKKQFGYHLMNGNIFYNEPNYVRVVQVGFDLTVKDPLIQ